MKPKHNWLPVAEAAEYLGITIGTMYSSMSHKRKEGNGHWFKKDGKQALVDVVQYRSMRNHDTDLTGKAQELYYEVIELFNSDHSLAERVAAILDIKTSAVTMRLANFKFHKEKTAKQMIFAFEQIIKEKGAAA